MSEGSKGIFIAKFNKTGNVLWRKLISGISNPINPILFDISETDDKSLLIAGGTGILNYLFYSNKNPFGKVWLIKLDSNIQKITFEKEPRNNFNRYKNIATSIFEASDNSIDFTGFYNNKILIGRLNDNRTLNNSNVTFEDASDFGTSPTSFASFESEPYLQILPF